MEVLTDTHEISKNIPALYDCTCKIEAISVSIGKIKTIFIILKLELSIIVEIIATLIVLETVSLL